MDSIKDIFGNISEYINLAGYYFFGFLSLILVAVSLYNATRYIQKAIYNFARRIYYGGMVYYEIVPENNSLSENSRSVGMMDSASKIMPTDMGRGFSKFYWDRPQTVVAIKNDGETISMYIGVDARHVDESAIRSWASETGNTCRKVEDNEELGFDTKNPAVAVLSNYTPSNVEISPQNSTVGKVVSNLQELSGNNITGTFIASYEPMRDSERSLLVNHISGLLVKESGDQTGHLMVSKSVQAMADRNMSRAVFMAFSDNGSIKDSKTILQTVFNNITSLGSQVGQRSIGEENRMRSIYAVILGALSLGISWFTNGFVSPIFSIVVLVLALLSALTPVLTKPFISISSKNGIIPIPPFWRFSWRRMWRQFIVNNTPFDIDTKKLDRPYVAQPSTDIVIPVYRTPIMQITSFPSSSERINNISSSIVPQVALPEKIESEIKDKVTSGDVIFLGLSAKNNKPVFRTINDIGFGLGVGGIRGSGKTNQLLVDFIGMSYLSRKKDGIAGEYRINPLWIETKTENIKEIIKSVEQFNPKYLTIHDSNSPRRLSLEGSRITDPNVTVKDVENNTRTLTAAIKASYGNAMMGRGKTIFNAALLTVMLSTKKDIEDLGLTAHITNPSRPNVMEFMAILCGAKININIKESLEEFAKNKDSLLTNIQRQEERENLPQGELERVRILNTAIQSMVKFHDLGRENPFVSVLNIIEDLSTSDGLWDTKTPEGKPRKEYSIKSLINYGGPVIADFCPVEGEVVESSTVERFTMISNWLIWNAIQATKGGAEKRKDYTPIYADEITSFAGREEYDKNDCQAVISEATDKGRSYGVSYNFGYQSLYQVPAGMRKTIQGYSSLISMKFNSPDDIEDVMRRLPKSTIYSEENIPKLPRGVGIAMIEIEHQLRSAFTLCSPHAGTWAKSLSSSGNIMDAIDGIYEELKDNMEDMSSKKIRNNNKKNLINSYRDSDEFFSMENSSGRFHSNSEDTYDDDNDDYDNY